MVLIERLSYETILERVLLFLTMKTNNEPLNLDIFLRPIVSAQNILHNIIERLYSKTISHLDFLSKIRFKQIMNLLIWKFI